MVNAPFGHQLHGHERLDGVGGGENDFDGFNDR